MQGSFRRYRNGRYLLLTPSAEVLSAFDVVWRVTAHDELFGARSSCKCLRMRSAANPGTVAAIMHSSPKCTGSEKNSTKTTQPHFEMSLPVRCCGYQGRLVTRMILTA